MQRKVPIAAAARSACTVQNNAGEFFSSFPLASEQPFLGVTHLFTMVTVTISLILGFTYWSFLVICETAGEGLSCLNSTECYLRHPRKTKISALGTRYDIRLTAQPNAGGAATRDEVGYPGERKMTARPESYLQLQRGLNSITSSGEIPGDFGFDLELDSDSCSVTIFFAQICKGERGSVSSPVPPSTPLQDATRIDIFA